MTVVDRPVVPPVILPALAWAPPGRWTYALVALVFLIAVEGSSRGSFVTTFLAWVISVAMLGVWLFRLVPTLVHRRLRLTLREWALWIGMPVALFGAYAVTLSPVPFDLRLALSRPGMEAAATAIEADPDASFGWIGLYPVDRIDRFEGGFRFLIWGSGFLDPLGFAYSPDGEPPVIGEDYYTPINAGWWHWAESW
jgi:hypothetical protein